METFSKPGRSPGSRRGAGKAMTTETISIPPLHQCRIHNVFNKSNRFYKLKYHIIVFTYGFKPNRNAVAGKTQEKAVKKAEKIAKVPRAPRGIVRSEGRKEKCRRKSKPRTGGMPVRGHRGNGPGGGSGKFPEDQLIERSVSRTPGCASVQALSTLTITGSTPFRIGLKRHMLTFGSRRTASKSFS